MAKISDIVGIINRTLQDTQFGDKRFQRGDFYGITEVNEKADGEDFTESYPAINDNAGDSQIIALDDRKNFFIYHKIEDVDVENFIDDDDFGDARFVRTTYGMKCVLWADKRRIQLDRTQLLIGLTSGIPGNLIRTSVAALGLYSVEITLTGADVDAASVYRGEYNTRKMALQTNHVMISQSYEVETIHRQGCIDICEL